MAESASTTPTAANSTAASSTSGDSGHDILSDALAEMTSEGVLDDSGSPTEPTEGAASATPSNTSGTSNTHTTSTTDANEPASSTARADTSAAPSNTQAAPVSPDTSAVQATDPMAGTEPFTYDVDGQAKQFTGIYFIKGEGAMIPPDQVDHVRASLAFADRAIQQNRVLTDQVQSLNGLSYRAKDDSGQDRDFQGVEAFQRLTAEYARLDAEGRTVVAAMGDPSFVIGLALAYQNNDDKAAVRLINSVTERVRFAGDREHFKTIRETAQTARTTQTTAQEAQAVDGALEQQIGVMATWAKTNGVTLNDSDLTAARKHFGAFKQALYRDATPDELRQYGWTKGQKVIDTPKMHAWFEDRMTMRRSEAKRETDRVAADKAKTDSTKFNSAQDATRQPAKQPKTAQTHSTHTSTPSKDTPREKVSRAKAWDDAFDEGMADLNLPLSR